MKSSQKQPAAPTLTTPSGTQAASSSEPAMKNDAAKMLKSLKEENAIDEELVSRRDSAKHPKRPVVVDNEDEDQQDDDEDLTPPPSQTSSLSPPNYAPRYIAPLHSPSRIPTRLQGVFCALGPHNWGAYVYAVYQIATGEITVETFSVRCHQIYRVYDHATRKVINDLIAIHIVLPYMDETDEEEARQSEIESVVEKGKETAEEE